MGVGSVVGLLEGLEAGRDGTGAEPWNVLNPPLHGGPGYGSRLTPTRLPERNREGVSVCPEISV